MKFTYDVPDSKLSVFRVGERVVLGLRVSDVGPVAFEFSFNAVTEWAAELLVQSIRRRLMDAMESARRDAYELGWRDKSAKRTKRVYFWSRLP